MKYELGKRISSNLKLTIGLVVLFLALVVFIAYMVNKDKEIVVVPSNAAVDSVKYGIEEGDVSKKYTNKEFGFSFLFPKELEFSEILDNGGEAIFLKSGSGKNVFSVFIQLVGDAFELTPDFLKSQIEGLVIVKPKKIVIDGDAKGILFESASQDVGGESLEIWFLKEKYLYEVTVPKENSILGQQIVGTWRFN